MWLELKAYRRVDEKSSAQRSEQTPSEAINRAVSKQDQPRARSSLILQGMSPRSQSPGEISDPVR